MKKKTRRVKKQVKLKQFFVEFDYVQHVRGTILATDEAQAKQLIRESASNPDFDAMLDYTQPCEPDLEFHACYPDEDEK